PGAGDTAAPETATSQESEVRFMGAHAAVELLIQLADWLTSVAAHTVDVPVNGNFLYGTFYAASTGTAFDAVHTRDRPECVAIQGEDTVRRTRHGRGGIYSKLAPDAHAPRAPPSALPCGATDVALIRERLLKHYQAAAVVKATSRAPAIQWGRAVELQAAAAYLREPVYVIDVRSRHVRMATRSYCARMAHAQRSGVSGLCRCHDDAVRVTVRGKAGASGGTGVAARERTRTFPGAPLRRLRLRCLTRSGGSEGARRRYGSTPASRHPEEAGTCDN
ncbi:hypothetical protein PybrP1_000348, partial [[Pythium] brassicae (nom. inval.)]